MKSVNINMIFVAYVTAMLIGFSSVVQAERIRLDRKHGAVNSALQGMLAAQIKFFSGGVGKIELGRSGGKKDCTLDLFVSPNTVYVVLDSKKSRTHTEFYVDHPKDSFKSVLFQALVKQGDKVELSVDKKTGSYKFIVKGNDLTAEVKSQGKTSSCSFDLEKAVLLSGETE